MQTFVCSFFFLILTDEPERQSRGSAGGEFNRLIHISWTAYISSSTSVFQASAWFMEEIWIETKTLTNAEWLIFKWQIPSEGLYHRSAIQYMLSCGVSQCSSCLLCECAVNLSWFEVYQYLLCYSIWHFSWVPFFFPVRLNPSVPLPIFTESRHSCGTANYNTGSRRSDRLL